jgi:hypothetical protein
MPRSPRQLAPEIDRSTPFQSTAEQNPVEIISLKNKGDFLIHRVVLQNPGIRPDATMFHVKHFCVKRSNFPGRQKRTSGGSADVSRETFLRKTGREKRQPPATSAGNPVGTRFYGAGVPNGNRTRVFTVKG